MARFNKVQVICAMKETGMVPVFYNSDINLTGGVYSPIGIGLSTNYTIMKDKKIGDPTKTLSFGIGILKKF